jgi:hypothetical protein
MDEDEDRNFTSAGAEISIGISSSSVRWMTPPSAPDDVSISSRAGHSRSISETQPSAASTRSDLATEVISRTASFSRVLAREDPRQPNACARNLALKAHR